MNWPLSGDIGYGMADLFEWVASWVHVKVFIDSIRIIIPLCLKACKRFPFLPENGRHIREVVDSILLAVLFHSAISVQEA